MSRKLNRQSFGSPGNAGNLPGRSEVDQLLLDWVPNERLRLHMYQLGGLLRAWAERQNLDEHEVWLWEAAGLLHDADWEQWPDDHCARIIDWGESAGWDPELLHAIASHGPLHFGVEPVNELDHLIYALDELSGFVHAVSLVRPEGYAGMQVKSVKKKLKDKSFAAQVNRAEITDAAERAGHSLDELIRFIIEVQPTVALPGS
ncbi:hydrolase [Spirochaeta africana]|uniref:Putative HD superfamily hydrolase n=1 Tax=Spirochaeta africana (strain ATCC 700263 / DSM 8902 / Z-7692) TaxID=889378 RepID=H9ULM6_SPIAZ|nr:hydrolase [Spirochaeta africana]AFG38419.1 putative HD superfamily hydrolase [Spirochaeta africana DSM 8902]